MSPLKGGKKIQLSDMATLKTSEALMPILTCSACFRLYFGMQQLISIIEYHDEVAELGSLEGSIE